MSKKSERYVCVMEPAGRWMVWDTQAQVPAEYAKNVLVGLPRKKALLICKVLNSIAADTRFQSLAS